jgi:hypothetical protein
VPSLVEAAASAAVGGAVLALVTASMGAAARIDADAALLADELYRARQLEHLVDRASLAAGTGPGRPTALSALSAAAAEFGADTDGSGAVDPNTAETTALEVSPSGSTARVRIRIGRQTMTVLEATQSDGRISGFDAHGRVATAATASLVELELVPRTSGGFPARTMRFAIPARFLP